MRQTEINRSVWALFENAKDAATTGITQAVAGGRLNVDRALLPMIVTIINDAVDRTFSGGFKNVERQLERALVEARATQAPAAVAPSRKRTKKN